MSLVFKPNGYQVQALDPLLSTQQYSLPAVPEKHISQARANILSLALYKDKFLFAGFRAEIVAVWDLYKRSLETVISVDVRGVHVYKDYLVIVSWSGDIIIYSILDNFSLATVAAQFNTLMYDADSSEKHQLLFVCGFTRAIHYIDVSNPSNAHLVPTRQVALHQSSLSVRVIDNETKLVCSEGSSVVIIDIAASSILHRFDKSCGSPHTKSLWTTIEVGDYYVAAGGNDSKISIWNYRTGKLYKVIEEEKRIYHLKAVQCHDGRKLLYSLHLRQNGMSEDKVCVWDVDKDFEFVKHVIEHCETDNYALAVLADRQFSKTIQRFHQLLVQSWQVKNPLHADVTIFTQP